MNVWKCRTSGAILAIALVFLFVGHYKNGKMAEWVASFQPEEVGMESAGIYWTSPYAALARSGYQTLVVKLRHVKQVPARKTVIGDDQRLAILARSGLLRRGFVSLGNFRALRLSLRQVQKLTVIVAEYRNLG